MTIGYEIKRYRMQKRMSQREFGEEYGMIRNTISVIESDKQSPSLDKAYLFSIRCGFSLDALALEYKKEHDSLAKPRSDK